MMRRRGPGLVRMAARTAVVAGTATAVSGAVHHRQQGKYDQQAQEQYAQQEQAQMQAAAAAPAQYAAPAAEESYVAELEKLADLKAKGILTEEEFAAKKAQILGL